MHAENAKQKALLLKEAADLLKERMKKAPGLEMAQRFMTILYGHVAADEILRRSPEALMGAAVSLFKFAERRPKNTARIRLFNPGTDEQGWPSTHTLIQIVNDDMPFLVDSMLIRLNDHNLGCHLLAHPVIWAKRDGKGKLLDIASEAPEKADGWGRESFMSIEVDEVSLAERLAEIKEGLDAAFSDVRLAVVDWRRMMDRAGQVREALVAKKAKINAADKKEVGEFLAWAIDHHFTFLGARDYEYKKSGGKTELVQVEGSGLGILSDATRYVLHEPGVAETDAVKDWQNDEFPMVIAKARARSRVHRSTHMDYIGVKHYDEKGNQCGETRFVGLFTSTAYSRRPKDIPYLRQKIAAVERASDLDPASHGGKALTHVLDTYPRDELFQIGTEELLNTALGIMALEKRPDVRLFVRQDAFERFVSAVVFVPRDRYNSELRQKHEAMLAAAFGGNPSAFYTSLSTDALARIQFIIQTEPGAVRDVDILALEEELRDAATNWADELEHEMIDRWGEEGGLRRHGRFGAAFPIAYQERFRVHSGLFDIDQVEKIDAGAPVSVNLYRPLDDGDDVLRFKAFRRKETMSLSMVLPMLENMGFSVLEEHPFCLTPANEDPVWIHDFKLVSHGGEAVDLDVIKEPFQSCFIAVWTGQADNDSFNRLVLAAGLHWRDVVILRALSRYLRQARIPFSQDYIGQTLVNNGPVAQLLVSYFDARLNPEYSDKKREKLEKGLLEKLDTALDDVPNLDEDRILRRFLNVIQSILRTNFYQNDENGQPKAAVSFKLDSSNISDLPQPVPHREMWVYSPRVEAVHLRFGLVARGGLRWSDRMEDFRTEILGLVKAQRVKNAVIVPVGAKGGFICKQLPENDREAWLAEGVECYKTFMRSMLDITDNLVGGKLTRPENVVRHDGEDPYLVVAADKGTATFSDIANSVSLDFGHWLGDAFASGGSVGYDHKGMGITAKGAWESVKRHFREMGTDIQTTDFSVVGVGDMSGDVFGNGMLLSKHIQLVAAFNHLHIFIDPTPDSAKSWKERDRLFKLPRSNWADYDETLISKGGGIFDRSAKSITLTPEIKKCFGLKQDKMAPNDLIHEILKSQVDLLWFGGIGTYIKAASETNDQVGDKANDTLRVNGGDVGAKVIGEGANLGVTQLARIEYSLAGGRCNTDAVDNSAGVDCSDHEVNIKILVDNVVADGELTGKQRNRLLADMTDEVGDLVLRTNYLQSHAISQMVMQSKDLSQPHMRLMGALEETGGLDRDIEFLPSDDDLASRVGLERTGLTRPEISVLVAYAKMFLYDRLLDSDAPDETWFDEDLVNYFPTPLRKKYRENILNHPLRREINATLLANSVVNRMGASFVHQVRDISSVPAVDVARAYAVSREVFDLRAYWDGVDGLDNKVDAALQAELMGISQRAARTASIWFLRNMRQPLQIGDVIDRFKSSIKAIENKLEQMLTEAELVQFNAVVASYAEKGVPKATARSAAVLPYMSAALDICRVAMSSKRKVEDVGQVYFALGGRLGLDWLRAQAEKADANGHWARLAIRSIIEDMFAHQRHLTMAVLDEAGKGKAHDAIDIWLDANRQKVERGMKLIGEFRKTRDVDLSMLSIANHLINKLVQPEEDDDAL